MNILHLPISEPWFSKTVTGEKTEEYREISLYWLRRLLDYSDMPMEEPDEWKKVAEDILDDINSGHKAADVIKTYFCKLRKFDITRLVNGYGANRPTLDIECKGIRIGRGRPEWGAPTDRDVFIIEHGQILEKKNLKEK